MTAKSHNAAKEINRHQDQDVKTEMVKDVWSACVAALTVGSGLNSFFNGDMYLVYLAIAVSAGGIYLMLKRYDWL